MKSQRWFNNMANITFTIPSVLNAGGGEKKTESQEWVEEAVEEYEDREEARKAGLP